MLQRVTGSSRVKLGEGHLKHACTEGTNIIILIEGHLRSEWGCAHELGSLHLPFTERRRHHHHHHHHRHPQQQQHTTNNEQRTTKSMARSKDSLQRVARRRPTESGPSAFDPERLTLKHQSITHSKPFKSFVLWPRKKVQGSVSYRKRILETLGWIPYVMGYGRGEGIYVFIRWVFLLEQSSHILTPIFLFL